MTGRDKFPEILSRKVLVFDGAMGTVIYQRRWAGWKRRWRFWRE